jgi:hypothetical protein
MLAVWAGCDRAPLGDRGDTVGAVGVALQVGPGVSLTSASYLITGVDGFARAGSVAVGTSADVAVTVGDLPAASGYEITITGVASDDTTACAGSARFDVKPGASSKVIVHLVCRPHAAGLVEVSGNLNVCPVVDELSASPAEVLVGRALALVASAHDTDEGPTPLSYSWSASSGALSAPAAAETTFTCTAAGPATITVIVSDGDAHASCRGSLTVQVSCTAP